MSRPNLKRALALGTSLFPARLSAFSFTTNSPTQCDDLTVQWTGGTPPFRLLIVPPGSDSLNISIPSTAFVNNAGSFVTQLALAQHQRVLFTMSDATGTFAGGTSTLYEVGASVSGSQCNVTVPIPDFFFSLDNDFKQCKAFPFTQYPNAVQPVTIYGFIPNGQSFTLHPPPGASFSWNPVNLTAGTSVAFSMMDSLGRNGGVAPIQVVQLSDDNDSSCLSSSNSSGSPGKSSPGTGTTGTGTGTGSSNGGSSSPSASSTSGSKSNVGLIAGAAAGGACVVLLIFLALFCIRGRKNKKTANTRVRMSKDQPDLLYEPAGNPAPEGAAYLYMPTQYTVPPPVPRANGPPTTLSEKLLIQQQQQQIQRYSDPFRASMAQQTENRMSLYPSGTYAQTSYAGSSSQVQPQPQVQPALSVQNSTEWTPEHLFSGNTHSQASSSDGRSTTYPPQPATQPSSQRRLIVHTDIEESGEIEPVELPPQYAEGRAPIPGLMPDEPAQSSSSSTGVSTIPKRGKEKA